MTDEDEFLKKFLNSIEASKDDNKTETDPCVAWKYGSDSYNGSGFNASADNNCSKTFDLSTIILNNQSLTWINGRGSLGHDFFTYFTPVIFTIGLVGNILSLRVFLTKNMRKLSASVYLAALSVADLMALCFYVLTEWIRRGIPVESGQVTAPFLEQNGVCQILVYLQYISRFLCAWLVACFTLERYIGVCHPLKRKDICDVRSSRKIVFTLIITAFIVCSFKPFLSESVVAGNYNAPTCTRSQAHADLSFVFDCVFGVSITFLPFVIITVLNAFIIRKLLIRNKRHRECKVITEESIIRLEFTFILIAISFCFIAFNVPYSVVWYKLFVLSRDRFEKFNFLDTQDLLNFTRTIFYINYCINFFLYSITGAYFRKELKMLFTYKSKAYQNYHRCSVHNSNSNTPQSWL
ncbi:thyrotropin-releasing hormone receptor-like [Mizuhopecten yessoensis]|uniref:Thyrotropin-releasing hormone receptor n=1 Tax=Mizuhopecten yessoensis TaxID=6573 RepID=A0A210QVR9_MIZYE|nr:thyrotropin-releasing hormone receptor-like [Mizuhopecten yessoensis]OWF52805.1 Thyrotropin-releasing hormone receptor [Mizuhopecten yessoensis]